MNDAILTLQFRDSATLPAKDEPGHINRVEVTRAAVLIAVEVEQGPRESHLI
jgi:hypothetical protein